MAIAQIYTGRPNDILPAITQLDASEHEPGNVVDVGLDFLETSARLGDAASMAYLAEAFDTGLNLGSDREQSYSQVLCDSHKTQVNLEILTLLSRPNAI